MKTYLTGNIRLLLVKLACWFSLAVGAVAFSGWVWDIGSFKSVIPGAVQMKANTALALIFAACALWAVSAAQSSRYRFIRYLLAATVFLIGLLTLSQYLFDWDLNIDQLLFRDSANAYNIAPGRMSPFSAWTFVMLGMGLAALRRPKLGWLAYVAGLQITVVGSVSLLGYLWTAAELVTDKWLPPVAINTALIFVLLGLALLEVQARRPEPAADSEVSSLEVKVLFAMVSTLLVLVVSSSYAYRAVVSFLQDTDRIVTTLQSRFELQRTLSLASLAATHLRSGATPSSEQYIRDKRQLETAMTRLASEQADIPLRVAQLDRLAERMRVHLDFLERGSPGGVAVEVGLVDDIELLGTEIDEADRIRLAAQTARLENGRVMMLASRIVTIGLALSVFLVLTNSVRREMAKNAAARREIGLLNDSLEQRVLDRTAALNRTQARMNTFMQSLAHDLRQPLISVGGFGKLLDNRLAQQGEVEGRKFVQRILKAVNRVDACTDTLLQLGYVSQTALCRQTVDVSTLAESIVNRQRELYPERQTQIVVQNAMVAKADVKLLKLALENLIDNAWKFTASTKSPWIGVGASVDDSAVTTLWVKDNGAGFDMAYRDKLFLPFQRLHRVDEFEGLGTGLCIAEAIVARHGGRIWAEAQPNKGASFFFTLEPTSTATASANDSWEAAASPCIRTT